MAVAGTTPADARADALAWAESARDARRQLRHDLSTASTTLAEVLGRAPLDPAVGRVKLLFVLESLPGARKTDTRRTLARHGVVADAPVGSLSDAERARILGWFGGGSAR
jgi:hypothetical protein